MYSRNSYEHMAGFDHWRKWRHPVFDTLPNNAKTRASVFWPPFKVPPSSLSPLSCLRRA